VLHVRDLAGLLIFFEFGVAVIRVQGAVDPARGISVVADIEFEPQALRTGMN
jgi:hypothetical protein